MATIDNFKLTKTLGSGAFSKVKLAENEKGDKFALKIMKKYEKSKEKVKGKHWDLFYNEINALKSLKHPNILKLYSHSDDSVAIRPDGSKVEVIYMALEFAESGELFDFIAETGKFTEEEARYYFKQLIDVLEFMHSKGYAHRDIKPENFLLDENFNLLLADFGFVTKEKTSSVRKGTFGYMAPEVLSCQEYNCVESDLFSAAVLLFILATQHPPFHRAEPGDKYYKKILDGKFWDVFADDDLSEEFVDLITRMFSMNPKNRLTLNQIKRHPWYKGDTPSADEIKERFTKRKEILDKKSGKNEENATHHKPKKAISTKQEKRVRKFTQFYNVEDGDELVDAMVRFANEENYVYEKSKEFFRVTIVISDMGKETCILGNVLKKSTANDRCVEFVMLYGDKYVFDTAFGKFKSFLAAQIDTSDTE